MFIPWSRTIEHLTTNVSLSATANFILVAFPWFSCSTELWLYRAVLKEERLPWRRELISRGWDTRTVNHPLASSHYSNCCKTWKKSVTSSDTKSMLSLRHGSYYKLTIWKMYLRVPTEEDTSFSIPRKELCFPSKLHNSWKSNTSFRWENEGEVACQKEICFKWNIWQVKTVLEKTMCNCRPPWRVTWVLRTLNLKG